MLKNRSMFYPDGIWYKWDDEKQKPVPIDGYVYKVVNGEYVVIGKTDRTAIHEMIVLNDNPYINNAIEIPEEIIDSNDIPILGDKFTYKVIEHLLYAIKDGIVVAWYKDETNSWFTTPPSLESKEYIPSAPDVNVGLK
jgi:hypothetical protein